MNASQPPELLDILAEHGDVEAVPLTRIQLATAKAMARNWTAIPHVTHHDRVDLTALEDRRHAANRDREAGNRLTPLPYLLKAIAAVLTRIPRFSAAFDETLARLLYRKYCHIGIAIDTPNGLVVGVIRDVAQKSVAQIAGDARALSDRARGRGLSLVQMTGGCFTVSSLGALGGDGFTPIINGPEVAILGVGRLDEVPRRADGVIEWRRLLPVSLSYDHRVLSGSDAGRFMRALQAEVDVLTELHETRGVAHDDNG